MSFKQNAWAKIWSIEPGERSTKVRVSTSKKSKKTGEYEQDFSGFVTLAGDAHTKASKLKVGDTIKIGGCEVTSRYDKEKQKEYINFTVYTFETNEDQDNSTAAKSEAPATADEEEDPDSELPF